MLSVKIGCLILFCILAEAGRELCFKRAANGGALLMLIKQPFIWAGILLWAAELVAWVYVVAHLPLSIGFPLMSLTYVATILGGMWFFKEHVGRRHAIGAALITIGAVCVGVTGL